VTGQLEASAALLQGNEYPASIEQAGGCTPQSVPTRWKRSLFCFSFRQFNVDTKAVQPAAFTILTELSLLATKIIFAPIMETRGIKFSLTKIRSMVLKMKYAERYGQHDLPIIRSLYALMQNIIKSKDVTVREVTDTNA
jgi:hypothetical protein